MGGIVVVICLQISIFELLNTTIATVRIEWEELWFAYKLVSLNYWIQQADGTAWRGGVVICLQISIFELLNTTPLDKLVSELCCDLLTN